MSPSFLFQSKWILTVIYFAGRAASADCHLNSSDERELRVTNYSVKWAICEDISSNNRISTHAWLAIREGQLADHSSFLLMVNVSTLKTTLISASCVHCRPLRNQELSDSPYFRALQVNVDQSTPLQNAGLTRSLHEVAAPLLTVDLCPSRRNFDRELFEGLLRSPLRSPIPIGIAITGGWIRRFPDAFHYLINLQSQGHLDIDWINHSDSHPFDRAAPLAKNFLLKPGVPFDREVLQLEIELVERRQAPSVFFRFPGLVSEQKQIEALADKGLITLGADAWLAKGEHPKDGSLILIHGNGNEPLGVQLFLKRFLPNLKQLSSLSDAIGGI